VYTVLFRDLLGCQRKWLTRSLFLFGVNAVSVEVQMLFVQISLFVCLALFYPLLVHSLSFNYGMIRFLLFTVFSPLWVFWIMLPWYILRFGFTFFRIMFLLDFLLLYAYCYFVSTFAVTFIRARLSWSDL
jgi:hypothetical protein